MICEDSFSVDLIALIPQLNVWARSLARRGDDADDLVQETLARAWKYQDSFQRGSNLKAWVYQILRNQFLWKKKRYWRETPLEPVVEESLSQAPSQEDALAVKDLRAAMGALAADKREALMMVGVAGLSYQDVAAASDCAVGTVKSRVARARIELRETLGMTA